MSSYCICCLYPHGLYSLLDLEIKAIYLYVRKINFNYVVYISIHFFLIIFQLKSPLKNNWQKRGHYHFKHGNTVVVSFVAHFGPVSVNFDRALTVAE